MIDVCSVFSVKAQSSDGATRKIMWWLKILDLSCSFTYIGFWFVCNFQDRISLTFFKFLISLALLAVHRKQQSYKWMWRLQLNK